VAIPGLVLDDRTWDDLVEEARTRLPRLSPAWTDHNIHDPGITILELLAWLTETELYRMDKVGEALRAKLLALAGSPVRGPAPSRGAVAFALAQGAGPVLLPEHLVLRAATANARMRTESGVYVSGAALRSIVVEGEGKRSDRSAALMGGSGVALWGTDPRSASREATAFRLGFRPAPPADRPLSLWVALRGGGTDAAARAALIDERGACERDPDAGPVLHHGLRAVWEWFDGATWRELSDEAVRDDTRGLTLDGAVVITPPAIPERTLPPVDEGCAWLRCRLTEGRPDRPPVAEVIAVHAVAAVGLAPLHSPLPLTDRLDEIPALGERATMALDIDADAVVSRARLDPQGVPLRVLNRRPATPAMRGELEVDLQLVGVGNGTPGQSATLPAPCDAAELEVWTIVPGESAERWAIRPDLDASRRGDAHVTLDRDGSVLRFGDGESARVVPAGAAILIRAPLVSCASGNLPAGTRLALVGADDAWNRMSLLEPDQVNLLGAAPARIASRLDDPLLVVDAAGGREPEDEETAAARLLEDVWAHERLVAILDRYAATSLDEVPAAAVEESLVPRRAVTLPDLERIARATPGTAVARARAFAEFDPAVPGVPAAGTVTVVVVPHLPVGRPAPTPGLLAAVRAFLGRRRMVGTRLVVVGPRYVDVSIAVRLALAPGAEAASVEAEVVRRVEDYLHPLIGGPRQQGWPFGRAVYRAELLAEIDRTPGVMRAYDLRLRSASGAACTNLCIAPHCLPAPGTHSIEVEAA
jgi:predicted phage baseplate assembly protein